MFIIPYILEPYHTSKSEFKIWITWIFMVNGGKAIWETDETSIGEREVVKQYLEPNNIYGTVKFCNSDVLLVEIDTKRTKFSEFYNWNDMLQDRITDVASTELWRPWMWIGESEFGNKDSWGWKQEVDTIPLGKFGTVDTLWQLLRQHVL
jgi:hypothetical protein